MSSAEKAFINQSRLYLQSNYLPKIEHCVSKLTEEDLWWRPNEISNSVGNLLLHLEGNIRQWVVSGIGGASDVRERPAEFSTREGLTAEVLLDRLRKAVNDVEWVLANLDTSLLFEHRHIQGNEVTLFYAIYHVVEHFSMHTGQIMYITKQLHGTDLEFYQIRDGKARPNWSGARGV